MQIVIYKLLIVVIIYFVGNFRLDGNVYAT